ncbi:hypothetical protein D3C76_1766240 [compost metagenome]
MLSPCEASEHPHMSERGVYFKRDGLLQAHPAPRFDGQVVTPGPIASHGGDTAQVMAVLAGDDVTAVWRS